MNFVSMLYTTHVMQTLSQTPPFTHKVMYETNTINSFLLDNLFNDEAMFNSFATSCFDDFKTEYPKISFGSVHHNHITWVKIALNTIKKNKSNIILFPNGCCSQNNCQINLMYEMVLKKLHK